MISLIENYFKLLSVSDFHNIESDQCYVVHETLRWWIEEVSKRQESNAQYAKSKAKFNQKRQRSDCWFVWKWNWASEKNSIENDWNVKSESERKRRKFIEIDSNIESNRKQISNNRKTECQSMNYSKNM